MSTHEHIGGDSPDDTLAAEYVLHLLGADDRAATEERLDVDGGLRALVADWSERLVPLADDIDPVNPPSALRGTIEQTIADLQSDTRPASQTPRKRFSFGRLLGGGLVAAAIALLAVFFLPQIQPPGGGPVYVADVGSTEQELIVRARFDTATDTLTVTREQGQPPEGRELQVWLLTDDQPPHAVGILTEDTEVSVPVTPFWGQRIPTGQFAVSEEPPGGSSDETGPRGEVLAVGDVEEM